MYLPGARLTRIVDASAEPVSLAEAKLFCRVAGDEEDALIGQLITSARLECEERCDRSFLVQQWRLSFDGARYGHWGFRGNLWHHGHRDLAITLPRPALISVESYSHVAPGGTVTTLDPSAYRVAPGAPGRIYPAYGAAPFLDVGGYPGHYEIAYTAGYGSSPDDVPANVKQAILILAAFLYQNRSGDAPVPQAVDALLCRERLGTYG